MGKRVKDFRPARVNANRHTARGMSELQKSIQQDGWIGAMTTAADGEMIAGSARIETVAQVFGTDAEPIVVESDGTRPVVIVRKDIPTADDKRAQRLALADNRIAALDLAFDVEVISAMSVDVLGDLWTPSELSDLGQAWANEQEDAKRAAQEDAGAQVDKAAELQEKWQTASGQLWELGEHRLICGDCTDKATVERVMGGERAQAVVTDPPFNIGLSYDVYDDNKPQAEYLATMRLAFGIARDITDDKCHLTCTLGHNLIVPVRAEIESAGWKFRHLGVWHNPQRKAGSHPGMWPFAWEGVLDFTNGGYRKLNNSNGVGYSDVWIEPPGNDTEHPAERPSKMWHEIVGLVSDSGAVIYEPFSGSGTTIIACEKLGRKCRAVEISPAYVAVALERYFKTTGKTPVLLTD